MAMAYAFDGYAKQKRQPSEVSDQPNNSGFSTMLVGGGMEFGLCFRIFKQKGLKEKSKLTWRERWNYFSGNEKFEKEFDELDEKPTFRLVWD